MSRKRSHRGSLVFSLLFLLFVSGPVLAQLKPQHQEDTLLFREGEILFSKGEIERSLWRFRQLVVEHPRSHLVNESKFRMGICYTKLKRHKDAIQILHPLISAFSAPPRMFQLFSLLGDNYFELKDRSNALLWYGKGLLVPGQPHEELKNRVKSVIDTYGSEEDLKEIESLFRGAYAGGYAKWKLALKARKEGYDQLARKILTEMEREYRGFDYGALAKETREVTPPPLKSKYTVGAILPLSGIYKPFGEKALLAIRLALKEKSFRESPPLISLLVRDSNGNPSEAERAVEELVNRERVIAILGPLLSGTVDRTAKKAQQLKVPLISFSQKDPSLLKSDYVFQVSLSPLEQVQTLVAFATKELELRTFAVFYPNSPYGLHFKNLFVQEVVRMGGKVSGTVAYQEEQVDFRQEISGFFKLEPLEKEEVRKKREVEFRQSHFVEGLFIPDTHDRAGTLLSQMAYYDIRGTTFLGTSAWNGPQLIPVAGKGAEDAIFVDAFFRKNPQVKHFVEEFQKEYQSAPETLEAIAFDGSRLLREVLQFKSPSSPSELKDELRKAHQFLGVSGLKGFLENGRANRTLSVLRVKNGQFELFSR